LSITTDQSLPWRSSRGIRVRARLPGPQSPQSEAGQRRTAGALLYTGADTVAFGIVSLLCRSPRRGVGGQHGLGRQTSGTSPSRRPSLSGRKQQRVGVPLESIAEC
jgi:hypothetical protein